VQALQHFYSSEIIWKEFAKDEIEKEKEEIKKRKKIKEKKKKEK